MIDDELQNGRSPARVAYDEAVDALVLRVPILSVPTDAEFTTYDAARLAFYDDLAARWAGEDAQMLGQEEHTWRACKALDAAIEEYRQSCVRLRTARRVTL